MCYFKCLYLGNFSFRHLIHTLKKKKKGTLKIASLLLWINILEPYCSYCSKRYPIQRLEIITVTDFWSAEGSSLLLTSIHVHLNSYSLQSMIYPNFCTCGRYHKILKYSTSIITSCRVNFSPHIGRPPFPKSWFHILHLACAFKTL